jgi:hypothetical protein
MDNDDYEWEHILAGQVQSVIDANDKGLIKSISQYPIRNAFYEGICLGGNTRGMHEMTPDKPLHVLEVGLFKLMIEGSYVFYTTSQGWMHTQRYSNCWMCWLGSLVRHWATKATINCSSYLSLKLCY